MPCDAAVAAMILPIFLSPWRHDTKLALYMFMPADMMMR